MAGGSIYPSRGAVDERNAAADAKRMVGLGFDTANSAYVEQRIDFEGNATVKSWAEAANDEGRIFTLNRDDSLNNGDNLLVSIMTGTITDIVFEFRVDDGPASWVFSSGGTPTGGNADTFFNPNVVSGAASVATAIVNPVVAGSALIDSGSIGGGVGANSFGGRIGVPFRLIVPTATRLNFEMGSLGNGVECTISLTLAERV